MRVPIDEAFKGGQSNPRTPLLHKMFSYLGYGERAGSGLAMMNDIWKEKDWIVRRIEETFNPNRTTLILYSKEESSNYTNNYTKDYINNYPNQINKTQLKIIEIIKKNPTITAKELTENIQNITLACVKWNLKKMKDNGIITREGTARKGKWIIFEKRCSSRFRKKSKAYFMVKGDGAFCPCHVSKSDIGLFHPVLLFDIYK